MRPEDRVMFEIYRESNYNLKFRVVYFTELGDHVFDGFLGGEQKREAKKVIAGLVERLNEGEPLGPPEIERELEPFLA